MSRDILGSKQATILHSCFNENERYDLALKPHRQTKRKYQIKKTNTKKTKIAKQKHGFRKDETQFQNQIQIQYRNFKT